MADVLGFAGIATSAFALIFAIVAIALNSWISREVSGVETTVGLWKICIAGTCEDFNEDEVDSADMDTYRAIRAMIILGIIALLGAIVCQILKMFVMKDKEILSLVAGAVAAVAGVFLMIAMALYVGKLYEKDYKDQDFDLAAGFAMDIVAWILSWVGAGLLIASKLLTQST